MAVVRKIKIQLMYSFSGVVAGGAVILAVLELLSLIITKQLLTPGITLRVFTFESIALTLVLCVCGISLIRHEGLRARNFVGVALGIFWIANNLVCLYLGKLLSGISVVSVFIELAGCYIDLCLSGILMMAFIAAKHKPAYDKDFVIIPGCSISKQGGLLPLLKARTNRAIRFAWDQEIATGKSVRYIPSGGQGPDEIMSEGSAMEFYLLSHGAEQYEIFPEKKSVNTYENMLFSGKIIEEKKEGAKVCFATTNFHVLRSGMLARRVGLQAEGIASSTKWYFWPNGLAREVIAVLSMYRVQQLAGVVICFALSVLMQQVL